MSNFKTHCRIIDYLDAHHSELAQLVRGTCVDMTLGSTKGKAGLTFLMPDKKYREKIEKLAWSSNPAEATKACDMLNALILRDVFKTGTDFLTKRANIPNSLYPSQHVAIKDAKVGSVTFESGATAVPDSEFHDSSKKSNLAVWYLTGEIPVTTDKPAKIERGPAGRPTRGGKKGGYSQNIANELLAEERGKIAAVVENEYALCLLQKQVSGTPFEDPFVRCAMSLVKYLAESAPAVLDAAVPLLSLSKADFYFLIEPHKDGDWIVEGNLIKLWWESRAKYSASEGCGILLKRIAEAKNGAKLDEIHKIRKPVLDSCQSNGRGCVDAVERAYKSNMQLLGCATDEEVQNKLLQDELRFVIHCSFEELESAPYDSGALSEIVNTIGEYMHSLVDSKNEKTRAKRLLNPTVLRYAIAPTDKVEAVKAFVNSTYFMFLPITEQEASSIDKSVVMKPKPGISKLWNIMLGNYEKHHRIIDGAEHAGSNLKEILEKFAPESAKDILKALAERK